MAIINRIAEFHDDMTAWRRDLHAHPELGFQETRTSAVVAEKLRAFGFDEVHTGIATTGVVGVLRAGQGDDTIGLRADMDALPIEETTGKDYASTIKGCMHACGHDGHTTMLLGAARYLAETRNFNGTAYFIFQPAEEGDGGGRVMIEDGLFERFPMRQVYGMHNWPGRPVGSFAMRVGPIMAATDQFVIDVRGKGGHAAAPHMCLDPLITAAQIATAMQTIVSRNADPVENGVVSITQIHGGDALNVIPETAMLAGTARSFTPEVRRLLEQRIRDIPGHIARAHMIEAEVDFRRGYPATVNSEAETALAAGRGRRHRRRGQGRPRHAAGDGRRGLRLYAGEEARQLHLHRQWRRRDHADAAQSRLRFQRRGPAPRRQLLGAPGGTAAADRLTGEPPVA